jgi:hypothetical protein
MVSFRFTASDICLDYTHTLFTFLEFPMELYYEFHYFLHTDSAVGAWLFFSYLSVLQLRVSTIQSNHMCKGGSLAY